MTSFIFKFANADFVTDYLAIGGDLDADTEIAVQQAVEIVDLALVTHVFDARQEAVERLWRRLPEVDYRWDGIDDAGQPIPAAWFDRLTDWANQAIEAGGTVLTHCHMGINRGPSAGFAVLLSRGWNPIAALDAIRAARPQAFVAYAEYALEWHLERIGSSPSDIRAARARLAEWRTANPLDVRRAIRNGGRRSSGLAA